MVASSRDSRFSDSYVLCFSEGVCTRHGRIIPFSPSGAEDEETTVYIYICWDGPGVHVRSVKGAGHERPRSRELPDCHSKVGRVDSPLVIDLVYIYLFLWSPLARQTLSSSCRTTDALFPDHDGLSSSSLEISVPTGVETPTNNKYMTWIRQQVGRPDRPRAPRGDGLGGQWAHGKRPGRRAYACRTGSAERDGGLS